jgi:hypothetical protein
MNKKRGWKGARFISEKGGMVARRVFNIKPIEVHCNPDYDLELYETNEITAEGLLLVGKLKPKISSLPEFWLRWDEKREELDIDMRGDLKHREDWINSRNGYEGHHTEEVTGGERDFKVSIKMPNVNVFQGVLGFNLERDLEIIETVTISEEVIVKLTKETKPR